jgi:hypothetical protein
VLASALCLVAFLTSLILGRRSAAKGLVAVLAWGYLYGILRANIPSTASYFVFDCSLAGFYWARAHELLHDKSRRTQAIRIWTMVLVAWPCILCLLPFQDFLVSLVGLRGNIFFLPMLLVGAQLSGLDLRQTARGISWLNLVSFGFAISEYILGVTHFYPQNAVTTIIYASNDVAGYAYHRIPATFVTAHAYGGAMVTSLPLLFGFWARPGESAKAKTLVLCGIAAALVGVLLSATRLNFVTGAAVAAAMIAGREIPLKKKAVMVGVLALVAFFAANNERLNRFKSLGDSNAVASRIGGSVNRGFWEVIDEYPMGNGLGGGGTSIPAFLMDRIHRPVMIENEYGRIALEQGLFGLALWIAFLLWFVVSSAAFVKTPWSGGRRVAWVCCTVYFLIGPIGIGLFTSVPESLSLFLFMGWVGVNPSFEGLREETRIVRALPRFPDHELIGA